MKFIKDHAANPLQLRVGLQAAKEKPGCDHLQLSPVAALVFVANGVANALADRLAQLLGEA